MANPAIQAVTATFGQILVSTQLATTSATSVYTVASSKTVKIAQGSLCNVSAAPVTVSVALLKSGDTDNGTHNIISGFILPAGETLELAVLRGHMLGELEAISVTAGTAAAIDVVISGAVSS